MSATLSVVVTTYNRPAKLLRFLESVAEQSMKPDEVIVINDGSTADYSKPKQFIQSADHIQWIDQENAGVSAARNHGIRISSGLFIAFCDDDDYWLPHHIATLLQEIATQKATPGIYHTFRRKLTGSTFVDPPIHTKPKEITWQEHYITQGEMILFCTCIHQDVATFSPFPEGVTYAEDHEQRLIALSRFPCFPIHQRTVVIDRTEESATNRSIHDIADIYRHRFDAMFAIPAIGQHIRRLFRHRARFRWTSLEISEGRSKGTVPFIQQWLKATIQVRSWSNAKTMVLHMMWFLTQDLLKESVR